MTKAQAWLAGGVLLGALLLVGCPKSPSTTTAPVPPPAPPPTTSATALTGAALGEQIYKTGIGVSGTHIAFTEGSDRFQAKPGGCVGCHGEDAMGKTIPGKMTMPAVTYAALRESVNGKPAVFPSDAAVRTAVVEGKDESGEALSPMMPRWQFTDEEFGALAEYLKQLSKAPAAPKPAS